jgi:hypothetical protein
MLAMSSYPPEYVEAARAAVEARVAAYRKVAGDGPAFEEFEPVFFNDLVVVLENYFVHRLRAAEGKDGNPLNEVRLIATSLMSGDGRMVADKQIKLHPGSSVLGYAPGDAIAVRADGFARLTKAFFTELSTRYSA